MSTDRVSLKVPARDEYAKIVRLTAAAIVSRMDWSYDAVDDVRIAAEEAFIYATETLTPEEDVAIEFIVDEEWLEMDVALGIDVADTESVASRTDYCSFILQAVCDSHELVSMPSDERLLRLRIHGVGSDDA